MQQVNESYVVRWSLKWFGRRLEATQKSLAGLKHRVSGKGYMQGVKDACDFKVRRVTVNANRETRRKKL